MQASGKNVLSKKAVTGLNVKRIALMTGISGQDGSYLTEFLVERDYEVHGVSPYGRRELCPQAATLHFADLSDGSNLESILDEVQPDEVYNLGAQSHVRLSFDLPVYTADVTGLGVLRLLEAIRLHQNRTGRNVRF